MLKIFKTARLEEIYIRELQDFSFLSLKCYLLFLRSEEGWLSMTVLSNDNPQLNQIPVKEKRGSCKNLFKWTEKQHTEIFKQINVVHVHRAQLWNKNQKLQICQQQTV